MNDTQALRCGHALRGRRWVTAALLALALAPLACSPGGSSARRASPSATITTSPITTSSSTTSTVAAPSRLDIVATDYEWSGLPDRLPAGTYPLTLRNDGPDVHEIQVFRNTDDLSLPDLFALGPVEMKARVELAGGAIVVPGATSEETTLQLEPGTYEVVCFVPAATDQRPHFEHGMHRTLVVD